MKRLLIIVLSVLSLGSCLRNEVVDDPVPEPKPEPPIELSNQMKISVGTAVFSAQLEVNSTVEAFKQLLPMAVNMGELNGNEKYYYLPLAIPASATNPGIIQNGDIMLYGSDCLVLFYKSFSTSYRYTRIGKVDNPSGLESALGSGGVNVKFELIENE